MFSLVLVWRRGLYRSGICGPGPRNPVIDELSSHLPSPSASVSDLSGGGYRAGDRTGNEINYLR